MRVARVVAQAKVNLFLRVGPRDATGYHGITTLFHRVDLADDILVHAGGAARTLSVAGPQLPSNRLGAPEANLAYRAAVAYAERAGWPSGFSIELSKNIPVGAGLGGGSADAGAVLRALDALAPRSLGGEALLDLSSSLGSDVPFMATEHVAAIGTGRGELLHATDPMPSRDLLIVVPGFPIATADAYRWLDESRPEPPPVPEPPWLVPAQGFSSWELLPHMPFAGNDFEEPVERRHPELRSYRARLTSAGAKMARLCGSGSCVFGVFEGGAPKSRDLALQASVIATRTSARVVQVEVLE
jgi:4-diphosphocytidyl-2-C-methyl-D-erythritol kinase